MAAAATRTASGAVFSTSLCSRCWVQSRMGPAQTILISGPLLDDAVKWLGGEETFVGDVVSEEDKPIKHTKDQDQVWFALTTIGAPLLVLTLGLVGTRKRRAKKKSEVKP